MKHGRSEDDEMEDARAAAERELTRLSRILEAQTEELGTCYSQVCHGAASHYDRGPLVGL